MFSTEECIEILNHDTLELFSGVVVNCNTNTLEIASRDLSIVLNESQKRLLVCLNEKICTKRNIINVVWYENHQRISDNNYHQLTFQLRALFQRNNLPANLLITVPYYGLKLNEKQWQAIETNHQIDNTKNEDKKHIQTRHHDNKNNHEIRNYKETNAIKNISNDKKSDKITPVDNTADKVKPFILSHYFSRSTIAQNTLIVCMFAALVMFIR